MKSKLEVAIGDALTKHPHEYIIDTCWVEQLVGEGSTTEFRFMKPSLDREAFSTQKVIVAAHPIVIDIKDMTPEEIAVAMLSAADTEIAMLFPSLQISVGSAVQILTVNDILNAISELDAVHANTIGEYSCFVHPQQLDQLAEDADKSNYGIAKVCRNDDGEVEYILVCDTTVKKRAAIMSSRPCFIGAMYCNHTIGVVTGSLSIKDNQLTFQFGCGLVRPNLGARIISNKEHKNG